MFQGSFVKPAPCLYYPERTASVRHQFVDQPLSASQVDLYLSKGWRHFSAFFFCDDCADCLRCVPLRIPVDEFVPSRSQRRVLRKNRETEVCFFELEQFARDYLIDGYLLYRKFVEQRYHQEGPTLSLYVQQFFASPVPGKVSAFFIDGSLVGCGFLDVGKEALSTLYFVFDPAYSMFSLGTFSILQELAWAQAQGQRYYYLGYYLEGKPAMAYKARFQPCQVYDFLKGCWSPGSRVKLSE